MVANLGKLNYKYCMNFHCEEQIKAIHRDENRLK